MRFFISKVIIVVYLLVYIRKSCTIIVPAIPYANVEKKLLTTYTCLCKNLYTPSFLLPLSPLIVKR